MYFRKTFEVVVQVERPPINMMLIFDDKVL